MVTQKDKTKNPPPPLFLVVGSGIRDKHLGSAAYRFSTLLLCTAGRGRARHQARDDLGQPQLHPVPGYRARHGEGGARVPGRGVGPVGVCADSAEARRRRHCRAQAQLRHVRGKGTPTTRI
jgi:hypothetical protein